MSLYRDYTPLHFNGREFVSGNEVDLYAEVLKHIIRNDKYRDVETIRKNIRDHIPDLGTLLDLNSAILIEEGMLPEEITGLRLLRSLFFAAERRSFVDHPKLGRLEWASEFLISRLHMLPFECFTMLCLTEDGLLKDEVLLGIGNRNSVTFDLRRIERMIRKVQPHSVVFAHNHPGNTTTPSLHDIECTRYAFPRLKKLGVPLLDHLIITVHGSTSMRANQYIREMQWLAQAPGHWNLEHWLQKDEGWPKICNRLDLSCFFGYEYQSRLWPPPVKDD